MEMVRTSQEVLQLVQDKSAIMTVVDARSAGRFNGTEPEPRPGLRSGHIPKSRSVPFVKLLDTSNYSTFKSSEDIAKVFSDANVNVHSKEPIVLSCGSGLTACVLAFGLNLLNRNERGSVAVYDGSWTEWGCATRTHLPVEK